MHESKVFELFRVSRGELKLSRNVASQSEKISEYLRLTLCWLQSQTWRLAFTCALLDLASRFPYVFACRSTRLQMAESRLGIEASSQ